MAQKIAITLDVFSSMSLSKQLCTNLLAAIECGRIRAGEKLPSIRDMSKQLQISTITVREALDQLSELGVVVAKHGSGTFVSTTANRVSVPVQQAAELTFTQATYESSDYQLDDKFHWSSEAAHLNQSFNESAFHPWWDVLVNYDFRVYQPGINTTAGLHWHQIVRQYEFVDTQELDPTNVQGNNSLRAYVSRWLNRTCNLSTSSDDIFLVSGAQHARDLVASILVTDGRPVVVEEPGSITDLLAYASKGAEIIHVVQDEQGICTDLLPVQDNVVAHLITSANFPTGASLSESRAAEILNWAKKTNAVIVEDSYGTGFVHKEVPLVSLLQVAGTSSARENIIYIGSFSQLINPALRLAFMVAPKKFHNALALACWLAKAVPSNLSQQLMLNYFVQGYFDEDVLRVTQAARLRRKALVETLQQWPAHLIEFSPVAGGFHQVLWFNDSIDDLRVFEKALARGIGVVPLSPYFHGDDYRSGISLSFAQMSEAKIREGLGLLLPVILESSQSGSLR